MSKSILVVEDSMLVRTTLRKILGELGYQTTCAPSAQMAIELLDAGRPDLLLINPSLPVNSGMELLYEMQTYEDLKSIPSILMVDRPELYAAHRQNLSQLHVQLIVQRSELTSERLQNYLEHVLLAVA